MPANKAYLLDMGWIHEDIGMFLSYFAPREIHARFPDGTVDIPVSAVVVEHKEGLVLFDTGFRTDAEKYFPVKFAEENRIENQLSKIGYSPKDISFIAISHLHFDHAGQLAVFKDLRTPIIINKNELQYALYLIWQGKGGGYLADDLLPLRNAAWHPINKESFELFDGIKFIWTGTHTPGHMIMDVELLTGKKYLFIGDFIHIPEQYDIEDGGWLLGDQEEFHANIRKMKLLAPPRNKTNIVIGHDQHLWQKFPKAPNALE